VPAIARWCYQRRRLVLGVWIITFVVLAVFNNSIGASYANKFTLPHTPSATALSLLQKNFPAVSGETDEIVFEATGGATLQTPSVKAAIDRVLAAEAKLPHVKEVVSPYGALGARQVSRDGTIAFADLYLDKYSNLVPEADLKNIIKVAKTADSGQLEVSLEGQGIELVEQTSMSFTSLLIGGVLALGVMFIAFVSFYSALMPLLTAIMAILIGTQLTGLLTHVLSVASFATELGYLIGLGVGIDYSLFIITRHRSAVRAGRPIDESVVNAVNTAGRAVFFAGLTVVIALLGQFVLGLSFLDGVAVTAALTVALTMVSALTLLPAMLGFLGLKVLSRKERRVLLAGSAPPEETSGFWLRWARIVEKRAPVLALVGVVIVVTLALPIFSLRLGTSDAGNDPKGSTTLQAYQTLAKGFGPGFNGPLQLVADLRAPGDLATFDRVLNQVSHTPGIVTVTPPVSSPNGRIALAIAYQSTTPQAAKTGSLVHTLRSKVIPGAIGHSNLAVYVGGFTAATVDFSHVLAKKLPQFIGVVVLLAFLLLMVVFRSLVIPLTASIMNLLSVGASLGILNAVFEWGWGRSLFGLAETGPVEAFIPIIMFSILFGLSMDYEVFLVSRMHEQWTKTRDNRDAITRGQAETGRVITAAATIMIFVFAGFVFGGSRIIKEFGIGLGGSILIDAFVIRTLLVPSLMHLMGKANWWLPEWLNRGLPRVNVEGAAPVEPSGLEAALG
jgi:RND superfamily putative drug exporter